MSKFYTDSFVKSKIVFFVLVLLWLPGGVVWGQVTETFSSSGTFTVPAGVFSIKVEAWGGGGGGGGAYANSNTDRFGGGGGGGAFTTNTISVIPGQVINYTIGAGGAGGSGNNTNFAGTGGSTIFNTVTANGGNGGRNAYGTNGTGGSGATGNRNGGNGGNASTTYSGGGGGGAGNNGNGVAGSNSNPGGGTGGVGNPNIAPYRGGDGGNRVSGNSNGNSGTAPGGGGSGSSRTSSTGSQTGGTGGMGQIVITYTPTGTYKDSWVSMNTGSANWCAGETRTVTVTVTNIGTAPWIDIPGVQDINIGVKWDGDPDYLVITDVAGLAPGSTGTYSFNVTAPAAGTNHLTFDVVYEAVSWFGNNGNGVGTGNVAFTSAALTINSAPAQPSTIAGTTSVCEGSSQTYLVTNVAGVTYAWNTPAGWTLNSGQGTNSVNYTVGSAGGTVQVTPSGCGTGSPRTLAVSLAVPPSITTHPFTATSFYCLNAASTALTVSAGGTGLTYQWYRNTSPSNSGGTSMGAANGAQTASFTPPTNTIGTYYYYVAVTGTCTPAATSNVSGAITTYSLPTSYTVTGSGNYCSSAPGPVGLSNSEPGVHYQLFRGATAIGSSVAGTGSALDFGPQATTGTYTVVATNATTNCTNNMTGSAVINITPTPNTTFTYTTYSYCKTGTSGNATFSGSPTSGIFSASPAGLNFVSTSTGQINLATSTAGTYSITYTVAATGGCGIYTYTQPTSVVINAAPTASAGADIVSCSVPITMTGATATGTYTSVAWTGGTGLGTFSGSGSDPSSYLFTPSVPQGSFTATLTVTGAAPCNGTNPTSTRKITWGSSGSWLGVTSTNWFDATNWCGGVPTATTDVTIPAVGTVPNQPTINATGAVSRNIINNGTLTISNANSNLDVYGDWTNNSTLTAGANTSVTFRGSTSNTLTGSAATTFSNLVVNKAATANTLTSTTKAFTATNLIVTQGNLILTATDADYNVTGDITVPVAGILTHNVDWGTGRLLGVGGNISVDGVFNYAGTRSHVQMSGVGKTVRTGGNASSAFAILTLVSTGNISANGTLRVNDNFWAMFGTTGSFSTGANTIYANAGLLMNNGSVNLNGGTLNVSGGLSIGNGNPATFNFTAGTLNADGVSVGVGNARGILNHSGGVANIHNLGITNTTTASSYACTGAPVINISGNWINDETAANSFGAASSQVNFVGDAVQIIGGGAITIFNNLNINNAAGVTLSNSTNVNSTLSLTNGLVTTGGNTITVNVSGSITNASPTSYINGRLAQIYNSNISKIYPVGKGGNYRPVTFAYVSRSGTSTVTVEQMEGNIGAPVAPAVGFTARYWNITQNGASNLNYKVTLNDPAYTPIGFPKILKREGTAANPINVYDATTPNYTNLTGFTSFNGTTNGTNSFAIGWDCSSSAAAGPAVADFCQGGSTPPLGGSVSGTATGGTWSSSAGGTFSPSASDLNATWTPPANYYGTATLTLTPTGGLCAPNTVASKTVNIIQGPSGTFTATETSGLASNDRIICAGATVTFTAPAGYGSYIFRNGATILQTATNNVYNISTLPVGTHSITVEVANSNNCAVTFGPIAITVTPLPTPTLSASKTTICAGESITFTATGGSVGTTYNFKVNNATVQNSTSAIYTSTLLSNNDKVTVEITNENKCSAISSEITITVNPLPTGTFTSTNPSVCAGENITFTASGGIEYQFSVGGDVVQGFGNANTFNSSSLLNGDVVTVEVKNAAGCNGTFPAYPAIPVTINSLPTGTLTVTENSGTPDDLSICANAPVTYSFPTGYKNYDFRVNGVSVQSTSSNTYINTTLPAGAVVTVIVQTNSNCTATFTASTVTIAPSPIGSLTNNVTNNTICAGENVTFTATPGAGNNYNFKINGTQASVGIANTFTTNLLADGDVVTVEVTNTNGCMTIFNSITMTVTALPTGTMTISETSGISDDDGIICAGSVVSFTIPTGFTNYNFLLNGASVQNGGSAIYTNSTLATGNIVTVAVTNAGGCIALLNEYTITVNLLPIVAVITGPAEVCAEGNISLINATPGGKWSSSDAGIATVDENTGVVTGVSAGTTDIYYTVLNTTTNCSNRATKSVTVNALPVVASIVGDLNVCVGSTTILSNATGGGMWSSDNTGVATINASGNVTGVTNGTANISYTVTNAKGCITVITVALNVHALPVVTAIAGKLDVCINATTTLTNTTTGGAWTSSNPLIATVNSVTGVITGVAQGTVVISYTLTNSNNCETTVTENVLVNPLPVPFLSGANPICPNSTETYTTQAGQTNYTWTQTGGTIQSGGSTNENEITITWDQPGARTIYVNYTDVNGCSGANSATLETSTGTIPELNGDLTVCLNSDGSYVSQPGFTNYVWTATNGTVTPGTGSNEHTATVNWTASGNQTVTVNFMDANGCVAAAPTVRTVVVNPLPTATVTTSKTEVCQDATQPVITFTGANGTRPYTFTYTINGGTPQMVSTSSAQNFVTVTVPTGIAGTFDYQLISVLSNNTCTQPQNGVVSVTVTPTPSATITYSASPVCRSAPPITVTQTGTAGGVYSSTTGLTIDPATGAITPATSTPGTYTITYRVAASGGCLVYTTTASVTITAAPAATISYTGAPFCTTATPKSVSRTGSVGGTYSSTPGLTIDLNTGTINPSTSTPGNYTVNYTIAASGGCTEFTTTTNVTITAAPSATIAYSASPYCTGTGTASVTRSGSAGGIYSSSPAGLVIDANTGVINLVSSTGGTYTVTYSIASSGGCAAFLTTAIVVINPAPTAQAGTTSVLTCANSGAVNITAGSGAANYSSVLWTSSGTGTMANGTSLTAATYNPSAADITAGSVTLTLRANGIAGCGFVTSTKTMTISAVPTAYLIEPASATLCEGDVQALSASGGASGAGTMTFSSSGSNNNRAIGNPGNTTSTINIPNSGTPGGIPAGATITSVDVKFNISHGYAGELVLNLRAPNTNVLNLVHQKGGSGDNFNTTISSTATNNINGNAPFNGVYRADRIIGVGAPQASTVNTFNQLLGTMAGNWVLSAQDIQGCRGFLCLGGNYAGTLNNWSITVNYNLPVNPLSVTWSPVTNLYTDIETTIPYSGQDLSTVFAKPSSGTTVYTATQTNASGCSTIKTVNIVTNATPVVSIVADYCAIPGFVSLTANSVPSASSYLWSNGATTKSIQVDVSGIYEVQAFVAGSSCPGEASIGVSNELVINGDFEQGDVNFNTDYRARTGVYYNGNATTGLYPEGDYAVDKNAFSSSNGTGYHKDFHGRDHTTGSGNFMMVNGSRNIIKIWEQTVNVLPNTDYYFSAWAMNLNPGSPARLRFEVNGVQVGTIADLNNAPKPTTEAQVGISNWVRFYSDPTWRSGPTTTTAVIRIINLNTAEGGNDFGLDDISFGTLSTFIQLVSAPETDAQTVCKNTAIENILYNVGNGSAAGPAVTGLPAGVTSVFDGDRLTISGTPTVAGNYTYTITTTGCGATTATGKITVDEQKIVLSSGNTAPVCKDAAMMDRVYTFSGTATSASVTALPAGLTGTVSGSTFTISGTPTVSAGVYPYTITTTGTCEPASITGSITVQEQTISLNSPAAIYNQTLCINTGITNIQYLVGGTGTGASAIGLPAGVTGNFVAGVFTIRGTPTVSGSFDYTVTTTGPCGAVTATGTINVTPAATIVLSSPAGSDAQFACNNLAITPITYVVNNATNASITGGALPAGISGSFAGGVFTISGSTTQTGIFNYTITTSGGCASATISGTITVNGQKIVLTSGAASPSVCVGALMTNIVYTISGEATGASIIGQPAGVSGTLSGNTFTVSGIPTAAAGSYPYTITTSGPNCSPATLTGTITVQPSAIGGTITPASSTCSGGSGSLTVVGAVGIITWQVSFDGGTTWNNTSPVNHSISQSYTNVNTGRQYRVEVSNNCGSVYSNVSMLGVHNLWTGAIDSDWQNAGNWSDNQLPSLTCPNVYIPNTPNKPVLNFGTGTIRNLFIDAGGELTVKGTGILEVAGNINNSGILDVIQGAVYFNGLSIQTIDASTFTNHAIKDLKIINSNGLTLSGPLDVYGSVTFGGSNGKFITNGHLTLKSNINNTAWLGNMTGGHSLSGDVTVERFINTGTDENLKAHRKSWQLLAVPTDGPQTIHQAWQEGATAPVNATTPNQNATGNPKPGYGTMIVSNAGGSSGAIGLGFDQYTSPGPSIKVWNSTTGGYDGPPSTLYAPIYNLKGYMVTVRGDRSVYTSNAPAVPTTLRSKGKLFTPAHPPSSTTVSAGLIESVGNPYASAIDLRKLSTSESLSTTFTVWDPRATGAYGLGSFTYLTKDENDGNFYATPQTESYGAGPQNYIESGQAFFIQAFGSSGTMGFPESAKVSGSNPQLLRGQGRDGRQSQLRTNLYVGMANNLTLADGNLIQYDASYSNGLDVLDARKMTNTSENLGLNSNGKLLSVERRAPIVEADTVFFNISGMRVQPYKFEFIASELSGFGVEGIIEDNYLQTKTPLNMEGTTEYNFTIENKAGSYATDRFRIVFKAAAGPLPVTFVSIKATQQSDDIAVNWKVENESNLKVYEVEKSLDGNRFMRSATIDALNNGAGNYNWLDKDVTPGWNYYRIKSIDQDGKISYSEVVRVMIELEAPLITVYPNPIVNGVINVHLVNQPAGNYKLRLLNSLGQTMVSKSITRDKGTSIEPLTWDYKLARGNYRIEITKPDGGVKLITVIY